MKSGAVTPHGGVYMDVSSVENLLEKYPTSFKDFKDASMNLPEEWLEIAPGLHFTLGGVQINEFCETSLPGLYAAGEAAGNMHGANRIGGSALPECSVFGQIAGENAALHTQFIRALEPHEKEVQEERERLTRLLDTGKNGHIRPIEIMRTLQDLMYDKVGVLRTGNGLRGAIEEIRELKAIVKGLYQSTQLDDRHPVSGCRGGVGWSHPPNLPGSSPPDPAADGISDPSAW